MIISGGEPTIHKDFLEIVRFAKQRFEHIVLMTNGIKFADIEFLKATVDAGVDRISIPFYTSIEKEHNYLVGNPKAFENVIHGISNIEMLLSEKVFDVRIKLLHAKFTYKQNPKSIDFISSHFPKIKRVSLNGFHIGKKALQHKDQCVVDFNESRLYNDETVQRLIDYNFNFQVCDMPLCAFSENTIDLLLKYNRVVRADEAFLKRPNQNSNIVHSSIYCPKECEICALANECTKIYGKNAMSFNYGIRPVINDDFKMY